MAGLRRGVSGFSSRWFPSAKAAAAEYVKGGDLGNDDRRRNFVLGRGAPLLKPTGQSNYAEHLLALSTWMRDQVRPVPSRRLGQVALLGTSGEFFTARVSHN